MGSMIKADMFDNMRELVAGMMKEYYEHKGIWVNSSVPYSLSSNRVTKGLVGMATHGTHAMLRDLNFPPCFWVVVMTTFMHLCNRRRWGRTTA